MNTMPKQTITRPAGNLREDLINNPLGACKCWIVARTHYSDGETGSCLESCRTHAFISYYKGRLGAITGLGNINILLYLQYSTNSQPSHAVTRGTKAEEFCPQQCPSRHKDCSSSESDRLPAATPVLLSRPRASR